MTQDACCISLTGSGNIGSPWEEPRQHHGPFLLSFCLKSLKINPKEKAVCYVCSFGGCSRKTTAGGCCWMNYGRTLKTPLSLFFLLCLSSGYGMSGSVLEDAARWESRHLLQELFNTEIQAYNEPEKNCTDPGRTCAGPRSPREREILKGGSTSGGRVWVSDQCCF